MLNSDDPVFLIQMIFVPVGGNDKTLLKLSPIIIRRKNMKIYYANLWCCNDWNNNNISCNKVVNNLCVALHLSAFPLPSLLNIIILKSIKFHSFSLWDRYQTAKSSKNMFIVGKTIPHDLTVWFFVGNLDIIIIPWSIRCPTILNEQRLFL